MGNTSGMNFSFRGRCRGGNSGCGPHPGHQGTLNNIVVIGQQGAAPPAWGHRPTKGSFIQAEPHQWARDNRASNSGHHKSEWDDGGNARKGRNSGQVPAWCGTNARSTLPGTRQVSSPIPGDTNTTGGNNPWTTRNSTGIPKPGILRDCRICNPRTSSGGTDPSSTLYGRAAGSGYTGSSRRGTDTSTARDARDTGRPSGRHHGHDDSRWW
jgi:hypothetical protein